jgi:hypothetical protein
MDDQGSNGLKSASSFPVAKILVFISALLVPFIGILWGKGLTPLVGGGAIPYIFLGTVISVMTLPAAALHRWIDKNHPNMGFNLGLTAGLCAGSCIWIGIFSLFSLFVFGSKSWDSWGMLLVSLGGLLLPWFLYRNARKMYSRKTQIPGMLLGFLLSPLYLAVLLFAFGRPL